jgi:YD repeat-containing protein
MCGSHLKTILRLAAVAVSVMALVISQFAFAGTDTYSYDALGRLIGVVFADGSSITYTYDAAGNRTAITQAATP